MDELQQARTVAVKACRACESGILERDTFCRWCGARQFDWQSGHLTKVSRAARSGAVRTSAATSATTVLGEPARADVYRSVSGPLVSAVVSGALAGAASDAQSRLLKRAALALISIPIWLIIVLLSPLDAYAAVKNLAR